jgi:hypothetical protein
MKCHKPGYVAKNCHITAQSRIGPITFADLSTGRRVTTASTISPICTVDLKHKKTNTHHWQYNALPRINSATAEATLNRQRERNDTYAVQTSCHRQYHTSNPYVQTTCNSRKNAAKYQTALTWQQMKTVQNPYTPIPLKRRKPAKFTNKSSHPKTNMKNQKMWTTKNSVT